MKYFIETTIKIRWANKTLPIKWLFLVNNEGHELTPSERDSVETNSLRTDEETEIFGIWNIDNRSFVVDVSEDEFNRLFNEGLVRILWPDDNTWLPVNGNSCDYTLTF